jgi:hypothetical protein
VICGAAWAPLRRFFAAPKTPRVRASARSTLVSHGVAALTNRPNRESGRPTIIAAPLYPFLVLERHGSPWWLYPAPMSAGIRELR